MVTATLIHCADESNSLIIPKKRDNGLIIVSEKHIKRHKDTTQTTKEVMPGTHQHCGQSSIPTVS